MFLVDLLSQTPPHLCQSSVNTSGGPRQARHFMAVSCISLKSSGFLRGESIGKMFVRSYVLKLKFEIWNKTKRHLKSIFASVPKTKKIAKCVAKRKHTAMSEHMPAFVFFQSAIREILYYSCYH